MKRAVRIPVIANGDIVDAASARRALALSGADGAMIGRGARGRPWALGRIAATLAGRPPPPAPAGAALRALICGHYEAMLSFYGRELGLRVARKHLGWYLEGIAGVGGAAVPAHGDDRRGGGAARAGARPCGLRRAGGGGGRMNGGGFEALWGAIPYPALVVDENDCIITANAATESFGATSLRQMLARPLGRFLGGDSAVLDVVGQARRNGVSVAQYNLMVGWSEQPPQLQNVHAAPLQDGEGAVLILMHPQGMAEKMDRSLGHRSAARSVTGMAAMLAHEIRNPLAGISGAAQLLEMSLGDADRELTGLIQAEAARIGKLVDRVEQFGDLQARPAQGAEHPRRARPGAAGGAGRLRRARAVLGGVRPLAAADRGRSRPAAAGVPEPAQERGRSGAARRRRDLGGDRLSARA